MEAAPLPATLEQALLPDMLEQPLLPDTLEQALLPDTLQTAPLPGTADEEMMSISGPAPQLCGRCLSHPPAYDATLAAADYAAPVDQLVLQLKFGARLALAPLFAQLLVAAVRRDSGWDAPQLLRL